MNLRQQLLQMAELRCCAPKGTQLRNFSESAATPAATTAQLLPPAPRETAVLSATPAATIAQLASCGTATAPTDDRITCQGCRNLWASRHCICHRKAGLTTRDLADDFINLPQRCDGFAPLARPP